MRLYGVLVVWALAALCVGAELVRLNNGHRQVVLKSHNRFRRSLAQGLVRNKDGALLPSARNMYEFKYNMGLERIAARWAENCQFVHSKPEQRKFTGEALYTFTHTVEPSVLVNNATAFWWAELPSLGVSASLEFTPSDINRGVGHFTQMAWGDTTSVGCAVKFCPKFALLVCNYSPAPIYETGSPCTVDSECTRYAHSKCNPERGLCVRGRLKSKTA